MKKLYPLLLLFWLLPSCTKEFQRDFPASPNAVEISLGLFQVSQAAIDFSPYPERSFFVLRDAAGQRYPFYLNQPAYTSRFAYFQVFPHPFEPDKRVTYEFAGDRYEYEFVSQDLGAVLEVVLSPGLCSNPNLKTDGQVTDHLSIVCRGFLPPEYNYPNPVFDLAIPGAIVCKPGKEEVATFEQITLLGETFENVHFSRVRQGVFTFETFFNRECGIVALRNNDTLYVLER